MSYEDFTEAEVVSFLRSECEEAGGQAVWAAGTGVSASFVSAVLRGRKPPSPHICAALGFRRVTVYRSYSGHERGTVPVIRRTAHPGGGR